MGRVSIGAAAVFDITNIMDSCSKHTKMENIGNRTQLSVLFGPSSGSIKVLGIIRYFFEGND